MRAIPCLAFILNCLVISSGCSKSRKETGVPIYIEVERMDPDLEKCFSEKLYHKWASLHSLEAHDIKEKCNEPNPLDIHFFKSYDEFDMDKDTAGTQKLMITVYGDGDTTNTFFQLQQFELQSEGLWMRRMNLGNFRVQDRPNDSINPGKVDKAEICEMMVHFAIIASFK